MWEVTPETRPVWQEIEIALCLPIKVQKDVSDKSLSQWKHATFTHSVNKQTKNMQHQTQIIAISTTETRQVLSSNCFSQWIPITVARIQTCQECLMQRADNECLINGSEVLSRYRIIQQH